MKQPEKDKKIKRPDTPLAATSEPVSMQQDRERRTLDSIKGSSLRLMQERRAKEKAESALKSAKERLASENMKNAGNALKNLKPSDY